MKKEDITIFRFDPKSPPEMSQSDLIKLDSMTEEEVHAAALSDPDAQPLTKEQLARMKRVIDLKKIRKKLDLSQKEFAERNVPTSIGKDQRLGTKTFSAGSSRPKSFKSNCP